MLQNTVAPTLFLATEHKLRAVRKANLQEFSGPPPLPEAQAGHHSPALKETEQREKVKIECFQIFLYHVLFFLEKGVPEKCPGVLQATNLLSSIDLFFPTITDKPKTIKLCGGGEKYIQLPFQKSLSFHNPLT